MLGSAATPRCAQAAGAPRRRGDAAGRRRRPLPRPPRRRRAARRLPAAASIRSIQVTGSQRLEPDTVRSYVELRPGDAYTREQLDQALKDLYATELFADVQIKDDARRADHPGAREPGDQPHRAGGQQAAQGREDQPRDPALRRARSSPARRRAPMSAGSSSCIAGRAASPRPSSRRWCSSTRTASISCSRSPRAPSPRSARSTSSATRSSPTASCAARWRPSSRGITKIFSSGTSYDPDRLAYDQQKLRQFYLTNGYADFRVVSAVAELTPDKRDFIITYVVEEGRALQVRRHRRRERDPRHQGRGAASR